MATPSITRRMINFADQAVYVIIIVIMIGAHLNLSILQTRRPFGTAVYKSTPSTGCGNQSCTRANLPVRS